METGRTDGGKENGKILVTGGAGVFWLFFFRGGCI